MKRHQRMTTGIEQESTLRARVGACLVGALILGLGTTGTAFGASNMGDDCEHSGKSFMRPVTDTSELALSVVDLTDTKDPAITAPPESDAEYSDSAAPLLFLTPRVESIVDDVFAEGESSLSDDGNVESPANMTPLADSVDDPIAAPAADPIDDAQPDMRHLLPSIQRQMYRTDI